MRRQYKIRAEPDCGREVIAEARTAIIAGLTEMLGYDPTHNKEDPSMKASFKDSTGRTQVHSVQSFDFVYFGFDIDVRDHEGVPEQLRESLTGYDNVHLRE